MGKSLLIVESPTKMKTLSKFLGKDFTVKATYGHIKDLPKSKIGVDIDKGFTPHFVLVKGKSKAVDEIKKVSSDAEHIYIGSDPDREGEAIAFHVAEVVGKKKNVKRVLFHEITKKGVLDALNNPTVLDVSKYDAQKARRILDRLVGYKISPLLWEKVSYGLSAGRVQSVALRLICDKEEEIERFTKEEYWTIEADLELPSGERFRATLERKGKDKIRISTKKEAEEIKKAIRKEQFIITNLQIKEKNVSPQPAFITSRLEQEASRKLRFSPKRTMALAQKLYEGVDMGEEEGLTGLITYMRTDSVRVSTEAVAEARQYINTNYGADYLPKTPHIFKNRKSAQDAHEAIRPAYIHITPEKAKPYLDKELFALYDLIWKRFVASQMTHKKLKTKVADISAADYVFVARGFHVLFDGFTKVYEEESASDTEETGEDKQGAAYLPEMKTGMKLTHTDTLLNQRFTMPPPRFTEASLIKTLETRGIGRPSTYATIVSTVQERTYARRDKGKLIPTSLGRTVNSLLKDFFPMIVDVDFTAKLEKKLDQIEGGKANWINSLEKFYGAFEKELSGAQEGMKSLKKEEKETDIKCDKCGSNMILRWGKNGEYLVCSGRPACKNKMNVTVDSSGAIRVVEQEVKGVCVECGGNMIEKSGRFGRFLACSNYPSCKHTEPFSLGFLCPNAGCTGKLVEKVSKMKRKFTACSRYPDCSFATNAEPTEGPCPACGAPTLFLYRKNLSCLRKECGWKSK
ncbi:MAG: type I DNA topoisomerase [Syntrophobacterales bacterium]|jgi:DNA topoisomerase-1|nr:type I DNA topoisomerase [Syntrophobacterales bacterium]